MNTKCIAQPLLSLEAWCLFVRSGRSSGYPPVKSLPISFETVAWNFQPIL